MASPSSSHSQIEKLLDEDDPYPFFHLVNNLFSEDDAIRGPADALYNAAMKAFPNAISNKLAFLIKRSPMTQTRIRCSTLFSRFLEKNWPLVHRMFHKKFKTFFIQLLQDEKEWEALKIHCTCVSNIAALLFPSHDWPELLELIFQWLFSPDPTLTKSASLILLNDLIPKCPDVFSPYADTMNLAFQELMDQGSDDNSVRTTAFSAAVKLIVYLATPSNHYLYYSLLTGMISVLEDAVYDQDLACNALDAMVVLAKAKPEFMIFHIKDIAEAMLMIASDANLKENTRKLAVHFLVTVAEGGDEGNGMIQNLPSDLIEELLTQLLLMLMCVDDDISWNEADPDYKDAGKTVISCYAEEAFSRLAIALGGDVIVRNSPDLLPDFFEDDDWKKRYAAVTSLSLITSGCSKMLVQYLEQSVEKIVELVRYQHPRVRWAAIQAICEFSKYLSPYFQEQCHPQVIPALSKAMDDFSNPRVQTHAVSAIETFSLTCFSNILKPYLKDIISKLLIFLQKGNIFSKETALNALSALVVSTKDDFKPFYSMVMPYLKLILVTIKANSNCMLVAKTLECITVIAVAVGKSVFSTDLEEIVKVLVSLQEYNCYLDPEDRVTSYLIRAWGRLCVSLGEDFCPYLSACMPLLIELAKQEDYLMARDCDSKNEPSSNALMEMFWACSMLGCIALHSKGGLHLWIVEVLKAVLPLVNFKFGDQVRFVAISVIPLLLQSAAIAMENKLPIPGILDSSIITLANAMIPPLVQALEAPNIKIQVQTLVSLQQCIQIAGTWGPDQTDIIGSIVMVPSAYFERKKERENTAKNKELLKEEIQDEENVCRQIRICLQILMKVYHARNVIPQVSYVKQMWQKDITLEERRMALGIFSDIAEQLREQGLMHYAGCIPHLLKACKDTNPDIQQIAACAIGIYAKFGRETFKKRLRVGLSSLEAIILQHPVGGGLEYIMAKEAAVSAYGKVCFFYCEEINSLYMYIDLWLFHLPLKCNFDEAKAAHSLLCSMIEKPETKVTGPDDGYISRIITIMAEVLWAGTNLATEETQKRMIQHLKMFEQKLADKFDGIRKLLPPNLQNTLYRYLA